MTLLHTMISARAAALRASRTPPWTDRTLVVPGDVLVSGTSLTDLARTVGTPVVLSGAAADGPGRSGPGMSGRAGTGLAGAGPRRSGKTGAGPGAPARSVTFVVVRVDAVVPPLHCPREVWVDAELEGCSPVLSAVRLLGRSGSGRTRRYHLRPDRSGALDLLVRLPADLRRHDLLAVPCVSCVALEDIER
ncbi:hypothetical protein ACFVQ3_10380 [Oerskovia sp. NPDC057915]|uniref:hypothetical protein n=1 Tax=Oerskovia sp. NPDC057915 TaxID=3346280 RepID=UPI0036DDD024